MAQSAAVALPTVAAWRTVVNDTFDAGGLPAHWRAYNGPYGSGQHSCAVPSHNTVSGGFLHLKLYYEPSPSAGKCGAAWYSGGLSLDRALSSVSQRVSIRFRVIETNGIQAHRIIPMRSADNGTGDGEEDFCESTPITFCSTFLHWHNMAGRERLKYWRDLTQWHTLVSTRNGYHVTTTLDGLTMMNFTGNAVSLPPLLMHVVLQQECNKLGCPATHTGSEDIQIDSIRVENPA